MTVKLDVSKIPQSSIAPDDVFIIKIPMGKYDISYAKGVMEAFNFCFPDNKCMIIPMDCDIQIVSQRVSEFIPATQEELFEYLNITA